MGEKLYLPREEFEKRLIKTQELIHQKGLDALIAFSSYQEREGHVCYLTNHHNSFPNAMSHIGLGYSAFLLPSKGKGILVSPMGYDAERVVGIENALTGWVLVPDLIKAIMEKNLGEAKIGVAGMDVIPVEYYGWLTKSLPKAEFVPCNEILESQRMIKSGNEIELLKTAARIADKALEAGIMAVKPGASQLDVENAARQAARQAGADFVARVRVANGKKVNPSGWPMTGDKKLEEGDLVFLEFIGWAGNYGFDNSRVAPVGKVEDEQLDYLNHLVEVTEWMTSTLCPGRQSPFVYTESRARQIMPFGHGIGLEIVESPLITINTRLDIKPGMVLCVEPTLISQKYGSMNIKNTVLITDQGVEVLSRCPMRFW